jgi:hypothetical protein
MVPIAWALLGFFNLRLDNPNFAALCFVMAVVSAIVLQQPESRK